jgi:phosphoenolpyruvate---glycerone phosphotransferase subunit DhaL
MIATDLEKTEFVVRTIAESCLANERYFSELDAVVGDGDFGYSLARGFEVLFDQWDSLDRADAGTFLTGVAMMLTSRIGGTSGPLWGTAFLRAGAKLKGVEKITNADLVAALRNSVEGIKKRGNSDLGDKTLLDALVPAIDELESALAKGANGHAALARMASVARKTADATASMQARRGRAAYTGERSIGSVDAGATAVAVLTEKLAAEWPTEAN